MMALNLILCTVLVIIGPNADQVLDADNTLNLGALARWVMSVTLLRIWEMTVCTEFKESNLVVAATIDMALMGKELNLRFSFSLNFKDIVKGFAVGPFAPGKKKLKDPFLHSSSRFDYLKKTKPRFH